MLKYALVDIVNRSVVISLDVTTPHNRATTVYSGDESLIERVRYKLSRSYSAFGQSA